MKINSYDTISSDTMFFDIEYPNGDLVVLKAIFDSELNFYITTPIGLDNDEMRNLIWPTILQERSLIFTEYNIERLQEKGYTIIEVISEDPFLWKPIKLEPSELESNRSKYFDKKIYSLSEVLETMNDTSFLGSIIKPL